MKIQAQLVAAVRYEFDPADSATLAAQIKSDDTGDLTCAVCGRPVKPWLPVADASFWSSPTGQRDPEDCFIMAPDTYGEPPTVFGACFRPRLRQVLAVSAQNGSSDGDNAAVCSDVLAQTVSFDPILFDGDGGELVVA